MILTAAHCIVKKVTVGGLLAKPVVPNSYYPTEESMYKVYLGFQNQNETESPSSATKVGVKKVIRVSVFF